MVQRGFVSQAVYTSKHTGFELRCFQYHYTVEPEKNSFYIIVYIPWLDYFIDLWKGRPKKCINRFFNNTYASFTLSPKLMGRETEMALKRWILKYATVLCRIICRCNSIQFSFFHLLAKTFIYIKESEHYYSIPWKYKVK